MDEEYELFERLRETALREHENGEFPSWLLAETVAIADNADRYRDKVYLVRVLVEQIGDFDPYAGTGCFGASVGTETIKATIAKIVS